MGVTLEELLKSREERHLKQMSLLQLYPGRTLISMTVVMPGPVKRDDRTRVVAAAGRQALEEAFSGTVLFLEARDPDTGFELFLVTDVPQEEAKRRCCTLEDEAPLGRLFDLDVIGPDGVPLERGDFGFPPRRCLLCPREARYCMRNHTHTQEELRQRIDAMIRSFENSAVNL